MNIPIPFLKEEIGAGDVVKAATSAVGIKPCAPCKQRAEKMNRAIQFVPKSAPAKPQPNVWTKPPEAPEGWEIEAQCDSAMLFRNGNKRIVWSVLNGQYRNSHSYCCSPDAGRQEWERRCRQGQ